MGNESNGRYEGEKYRGKFHGRGVFYYNNGNRYDGEWKDGLKNGTGIYYFKSGNRYEGEFKDDKINGKGIYYYKSGARYEGEFKDDKSNGKGILYYKSGNRYEGEFKDDKRNGKGIFYYTDGNRYEGEYKDGKRNGKGIYYYTDGNRYEGEYKDDKRNGKGILYYTNGRKDLMIYRNGELLREEQLGLGEESDESGSDLDHEALPEHDETSPPLQNPSRFAFLVGHNQGDLVCCVNDARRMSEKLSEFGYECTVKENLMMNDFDLSFQEFLRNAERESSTSLKRIFFYFSGHGYEEDGKLYLMCFGRRHMKLDKLLRSMNQMKSEVHVTVVIDACRDDESNQTWKSGDGGMTPPQVSKLQKSFILGFSCASGKRSEANKKPKRYEFVYFRITLFDEK